ncbi:MAG TPA: NTP transferase domain-containing protein [Pyrinomonadaceae bacterium]|nr:NTP transferase domain-containing protein [Pyrinomonadaceae bacterium]
MQINSDLIGVIPAAGLGTRMGGSLPKALLSVHGRPLLDHAIAALEQLAVSKIVVVVGHAADPVHEYLRTRDFGIEIAFACQEQRLGLPHAIAMARDILTTEFVVLCPDNIFSDLEDLQYAKQAFLSRRPPFLMVATVTPTHQRDRARYSSGAMRSLGPHLYEYAVVDGGQPQGLAMNSTGCTFFSRDSLKGLPSFTNVSAEVTLHTYLTQLATTGQPLIYLLRGMRYDFSTPADVHAYDALQDQLAQANAAGVSAILLNQAGEILLQHRDDNPAIRYPGHWALFGGTVESGESAHAAARREILEETSYNVENLGLFREFVHNGKRESAFGGEINASLDELSLSEGQGMDFVRPADLPKLLIRPDDRETLKAYFGVWDE